jgi:hypothetical protein
LVYEILFRAAAQTLLQISRDPRHLGAHIGFLAILHTWTQTLLHHPHIHCVVPGGGLSPDRRRWIGCRDNFFLPVKVLSRLFRGKFLSHVCEEFDDTPLTLTAGRSRLHDSRDGALRGPRPPSPAVKIWLRAEPAARQDR